MFQLIVPGRELFNEETLEFTTVPEQKLVLEHSLVSLSKWESKWKKPYLSKVDKTEEELTDYIRCMTITQNVNQECYKCLTTECINKVITYIEDPMTATTINEQPSKKGPGPIITAELIYYWMIALNIPHEYEKWHLNRLLTLIRVCNIENSPPKKMGKKEQMIRNHNLNKARQKALNTKG